MTEAEVDTAARHWTDVWSTKDPAEVSWFQSDPEPSMSLILEHCVGRGAAVDVGGGVSGIAPRLRGAGFDPVILLDIALPALQLAVVERGERWVALRGRRQDADRSRPQDAEPGHRLDPEGGPHQDAELPADGRGSTMSSPWVAPICSDVRTWRPPTPVRLWHDRALLHFMVTDDDLAAYVDTMAFAVDTGGIAVISAFAPDGPTRCSGLDVRRLDAEGIARTVADTFEMIATTTHVHDTPWHAPQPFTYAVLGRR